MQTSDNKKNPIIPSLNQTQLVCLGIIWELFSSTLIYNVEISTTSKNRLYTNIITTFTYLSPDCLLIDSLKTIKNNSLNVFHRILSSLGDCGWFDDVL